jgi:hypothetical protein
MTISPIDSIPGSRSGVPGALPEPPLTLRVVWSDPRVDEAGVHPHSLYVETFWLPVLGPSATWLLRHLVDGLEAAPGGVEIDLDETARSLGLGGAPGRRRAFHRSLDRCVHHDLACWPRPGTLAVRRAIGRVPRRQLLRLPLSLQERHRALESADPAGPPTAVLVRRTRLLALDLRMLGVDAGGIERHLQRRGAHPALAYESAQWAWSRAEDDGVAAAVQSVP